MVPLSGAAGVLGALLFLAAATNGLDVFSAVTSSPWTAESFGADKSRADGMRRYIRHAVIITIILTLAAALIAKSIWPILGAGVAIVYMYWLYTDALAKGAANANTGWVNP